jgi:hypothetical protein
MNAVPTVGLMIVAIKNITQRGGGIETSLKGDKQELGLTKRQKKRFEAHHMVVLRGLFGPQCASLGAPVAEQSKEPPLLDPAHGA